MDKRVAWWFSSLWQIPGTPIVISYGDRKVLEVDNEADARTVLYVLGRKGALPAREEKG